MHGWSTGPIRGIDNCQPFKPLSNIDNGENVTTAYSHVCVPGILLKNFISRTIYPAHEISAFVRHRRTTRFYTPHNRRALLPALILPKRQCRNGKSADLLISRLRLSMPSVVTSHRPHNDDDNPSRTQ